MWPAQGLCDIDNCSILKHAVKLDKEPRTLVKIGVDFSFSLKEYNLTSFWEPWLDPGGKG